MSSQSLPKFKFLHRRAIVPHQTLLDGKSITKDDDGKDLPNLDNVQGDIYFMFPKRWESFMFFNITDVAQFRKDLDSYAPNITSSSQTVKDLNKIGTEGGAKLDIVSSGIAFSKAGLTTIGVDDFLGDPHFDQGSLYNEKKQLGDTAQYDDVFNGDGKNHGVILLTAGKQDTCKKKINDIQAIFKKSISVVTIYEGRVRSGDGEFFGWRDGISQPALKNIGQSKPGQRIVNPGVIIMGYPGDPVYDDEDALARPGFTKDGSFMVFRKLEQNVLFLEDYVDKNWISIPAKVGQNGEVSLTTVQRKQLFAARMVGRFKAGVPLALSPYIEDTSFLHPDKINNFDYSEPDGRCPFAAHVRKTAPRNLLPIVSKEYLDSSVIVRAGIPYGDEISKEERDKWSKLTPDERENAVCARGLLFACYQSSIDNGFYRQTTGFANNDFFPLTGLVPQKIGPDPIISGPKPVTGTTGTTDISGEGEVTLQLINVQGEKYEVAGIAKRVVESATSFEQKFFVTSRGGEYYFVPSISTVKSWGAAAQSK